MNTKFKFQRAFTLAEMAIVVVLTGIILTMGLKMTVATLNNSAYAETAAKQAQIKVALINYLRTYGKLPCPDTNPVPTGSSAAPPAVCTASAGAAYGVVPWVTLQLSRDTALDGWKNFFAYRVANGVAPVKKNWTANTAIATTFDMNELTTPSIAITINQSDGFAPLSQITTNAVVVILSGGKNGFATKTVQGQPNSAVPAANLDETTNATPVQNTFVIRPYTERPGGRGPYDDLVVYMLPQDLLQPLVTEQTVSTCKAYCSACKAAGKGTAIPPSPPALPPNQPYCTGAGTPATSAAASPCTSAGNPYPSCTALPGTPAVCIVTTNPIPIGNPRPSCIN